MSSAPYASVPSNRRPSAGVARARREPASGVSAALRTIFLGLACFVAAASAFARQEVRPLFQSDGALAVTLQAPWAELQRNKDTRRHAAVLGYSDAQGKQHRIAATVETRGLTRLRECRFPPLRIRFERAATEGSLFAGQDSLKMVTHCRNGQESSQYYVQEMLAYRIYNQVTDRSFRVRPLDITYIDSQGGKPDVPRFAFLIEDVGDMARRNGLKRDPRARFLPGDYDARELGRFMLFQYLIGNTDWEILAGPQKDECCHNVRVAGTGETGLFAVPYDFDSAGMIATSYAAPHHSLPIKDVRQRLYRGFCRHNDALEAVRVEFLGHRQAIFGMIQSEHRLTAQRKRAMTGYFEDFYATLDDDDLFAREITGKCRK